MTQQLHRLTDRVWYMDPTVETDRPALGYIRGDNCSAMVDAGNSPAHFNAFIAALGMARLPMPSFCILTHWHWDHTFALPAVPFPSFASEKTAEYLRAAKNWDFHAADDAGKTSWDADECMRCEYPAIDRIRIETPTVTFRERLVIDLGGVEADCRFVGGPHSDDSVIVYVPQEKVLFAGDSSSGNFSLPNIAYDRALLDEHERILRAIPFEQYLHAHRPVMDRDALFAFLDAGRQRGYYTYD